MKKQLLKNLQPFANNKILLHKNQTTSNIVDGILQTHKQYKQQYKNIYNYFDANSIEEIAHNIYTFLKNEVPYKAESEHFQTLRSPTAILSLPADCKSYALFTAGVIDAFNRYEFTNIPYSFRFAGYSENKNLEHVFIVLYPKTNHEIWIDPCTSYFDERKKPYIYTDKIFKPMALYTLNGINPPNAKIANNQDISSWFNTVYDMFDNSTNKWKSRLRALKDRTPDERLQWYYQQIMNSKDPQDAIQYAELFGKKATQIDDTKNVSYTIAKGYNTMLSQVFPIDKFGGGLGVWNFPYNDIFVDLSKTQNMPSSGNVPIDENGEPQPTQKNTVLPLAAGALLLYKIFG